MMNQPEHAPSSKPATSRTERISLAIQLALSFAVAGGVFFYLLLAGGKADHAEEKRPTPPEPIVTEVIWPKEPPALRIKADTPVFAKLVFDKVRRSRDLTEPVLPVTGAVLASLRPGTEDAKDKKKDKDVRDENDKDKAKDAWQFATSDLLQAFADWQKAGADVQFQKTQRDAIKELADYRVEAQKEVVVRMEKLVEAGTERLKDLVAERVNLKQFDIQGRKEIHEAETAVKLAIRAEATLARQLQQAGLEPTALRSHAVEGEIVVAEIPEHFLERVRLGMTCKVTFFALPGREPFVGKVSSISPMINKDKRTANVQFTVTDAKKQIRPGMFAVVRLVTEEKALVMPADGILHVGDNDYALKGADDGTWQIIQVRIGELRGTDVEVLDGLKEGDRVLGQGAILLKPTVVRALQLQEANVAAADVEKPKKGNN
jgi:cobalt-zinc-cadmium efflux system membrane fusion protein